MKFEFTGNHVEITAIADMVLNIAAAVGKEQAAKEWVNETRDQFQNINHRNFYGGSWDAVMSQTDLDDGSARIYVGTLKLEPEAVIELSKILVKVVTMFMPIIVMLVSASAVVKSVRTQWESIKDGLFKDFEKKFHREKRYTMVGLWSDDLKIYGLCVVEDDGLGNGYHVTDVVYAKDSRIDYTMSVIHSVILNKYDFTEDDFDLSREEALELARDSLGALEKDLDGVKHARQTITNIHKRTELHVGDNF